MKIKMIISALCLSATLSVTSAKEVLTIYTSQPNEDAQQTIAAFEKSYPEIKVNWIRDGTTKLMARLQAEISAGATTPDILLIADSVTMEALKAEDLLAPHISKEATVYDKALYDPEGYYYGTKLITTGIAYHQQAPMKPTSWKDLTHKDVKNMVTMPSPLYSGAALIHLATLTDHEDLGWDYYTNLNTNKVMPQGGNGAVVSALSSGSQAYGVLVDYLAIREKAKGAPIEFVFPKEGVSLVTEPVAIMKDAQNPAAAKVFIDFLLSEEGQTLVLEQGYIPAHPELSVPKGFPSRDEIKLIPFDAQKALENAESNKAQFSKIFGAK